MKKGSYLQVILKSDKTVFTLKDIVLLWQEENIGAARIRLNYYVTNGHLYRLRRGIYIKDKNYSPLELATRIHTPSYVSFETVLAREGVIFQFQTAITVASYLTREITVDDQIYTFRKIKNTMLTNPAGIDHSRNTSVASKERALLDTLYSNTDYHFDNLREIDWANVRSWVPIYSHKKLAKKVDQLYQANAIGDLDDH